jgi:hypothetical protein
MVTVTLVALAGILRLDYVLNPDIKAGRRGADYLLLEKLSETFGSENSDCLLLLQDENLFSGTFVSRLRRLVGQLKSLEGVSRVYSLDDIVVFEGMIPTPLLPADLNDSAKLEAAKAKALSHPMIPGYLLSPDAGATVVMVGLDATLASSGRVQSVVDEIRALAETCANETGLTINLTGMPVIKQDMLSFMRRENLKMFTFPVALALVISLCLFRRVGAVLLVSLPPLLGVLWTLGLAGWLHGQWTLLSLAITTMVYVVGFANAVHLMLAMQQGLAGGMRLQEAAAETVRRVGPACALTSLTTAIGFGSLTLARSTDVSNLGLSCALGTMVTFLAVIVLIPLLAATFIGRTSFQTESGAAKNRGHTFFASIIDEVIKRPKTVAITGGVVTCLLAASALKLNVGSTDDWIPHQLDSVKTYKIYSESFGGSSLLHVLLEWQTPEGKPPDDLLEAVEEIHAIFEAEKTTGYPVSLWSLLRTIPFPTQDGGLGLLRLLPAEIVKLFLRTDQQCSQVTTRYQGTDLLSNMAAFQHLDQKLLALDRSHEALNINLTGPAVYQTRSVYRTVLDLGNSLLLAAVVITASLFVAFRSVRYGLLAMIPNMFPLALISATLYATDQPFDIAYTILFTICLGIAVDYTIHYLYRYRYYLHSGDAPAVAVRKGFLTVGRACGVTTVILVVGFGSVVISTITGYKIFGGLCCLGFIAALVGDLLILPALLLCFDKPNKKESHN